LALLLQESRFCNAHTCKPQRQGFVFDGCGMSAFVNQGIAKIPKYLEAYLSVKKIIKSKS
jgi:hypothetical protein